MSFLPDRSRNRNSPTYAARLDAALGEAIRLMELDIEKEYAIWRAADRYRVAEAEVRELYERGEG